MARILFVEPELRTDKLGLLYLSAVLKDAGHDVDLVMEVEGNEADHYIVDNEGVDFLMFSVATGDHDWYIQRNRELTAFHKDTFGFQTIVGGPHYTFFPRDGLYDTAVDYVVRGPGEDVILPLVAEGSTQKSIMGRLPFIEGLPPPDREILYKYHRFGRARMKRFIACRDCPNACSYCFNHLYHRIFKDQKARFYQTNSPRKMVDEVLAVRDEWGLELAYFNDDDFARDHDWLTEFCYLFKAEVGLQFCGSVRADSLTEDVVQQMAWAGCSFMNIALESAVPETQHMLRRGRVTNDHIINACEWFARYGVKVRLQNMVGLPVDDPLEDALLTLEANQALPITDSWCSVLQPFPKTDIWKKCVKMGLLNEATEAGTFTDDTPLDFPEPIRSRINRLAKWWYFAVKWKMSRAAVMDLIDIPLTPGQKDLIQRTRWEEAARVLYGM